VDRTLHLKLGPGGLADVEWAVQLLQLRHGRRVPALRTTSTPDGLRAAVAAGLLGPREGAALAAAWTSASRVRNAVMLARGRHADVVPASGAALERVARIMGYAPGAAADLLADYRRAAAAARGVVEELFRRERTDDFG
jgi:glutamate-ammonia-ligase adenylyltransferase